MLSLDIECAKWDYGGEVVRELIGAISSAIDRAQRIGILPKRQAMAPFLSDVNTYLAIPVAFRSLLSSRIVQGQLP